MTHALAVVCFALSVLSFWAIWFLFALSVPYAIGYLVHSYRGDEHNIRYNFRRLLLFNISAAAAYGVSFLFALVASTIDTLADNGLLIVFIAATAGRLPSFLSDMSTSWYGLVTLITTVFVAFLIFGLIGAMLSRSYIEPARSTIPMAAAGGFAAVWAFVLRLWLQDRGALTFFYSAEHTGLYIPLSACLLIWVSGALAGLVIARYEYASGVGNAWVCQVFGGFIGLALGTLYHVQMASEFFTTQPAASVFAIIEFLAPTIGAFLASIYVVWLIGQHRKGYSSR